MENKNGLLLFIERANFKGRILNFSGSNDAGINGIVRGNIPVGGVGIAVTQYAEVRTKFRVNMRSLKFVTVESLPSHFLKYGASFRAKG